MNDIIIAIDGPSASGKSTVSKAVAKSLNFVYVDSGSLYRAVTWFALKRISLILIRRKLLMN